MAMPARTAEVNPGAKDQLTPLRSQAVMKMDGGPLLRPSRIINRFNAIRKQVKIGLARTGKPTSEDGGLLAVPTGKENPAKVWPDVQPGEESFTIVLDAGSTNWKTFNAIKQSDGTIAADHLSTKIYPDDEVREVTVNDFISNMVRPIADAYRAKADSGSLEGPINVAVKFGFPHDYEENEGRTDAIIVDVASDGTYSKGWKFTDWVAGQKVNVTERMVEQLREQGIDIASIVIKNDTNAVAADEDAAQRAIAKREEERAIQKSQTKSGEIRKFPRILPGLRDKLSKKEVLPELVVLDAGFVAGGGTNGAAKGGINLELGRAKFSFDEYQEPDGEVHEKMQEMGLVKGDKHAEQETGAIIVSRIAATIALLDDKKLLDGGTEYAMQLLQIAKDDQAIVDKLALGTPPDELAFNDDNRRIIQDIAEGELLRAGVNYGILIANTIAASLPEDGADPNVQYGLRIEGSTLLKGLYLKDIAATVAQDLLGLTYAPEFIEADGNKGVASHAMSKKYFVPAA